MKTYTIKMETIIIEEIETELTKHGFFGGNVSACVLNGEVCYTENPYSFGITASDTFSPDSPYSIYFI